MNSSTFRLRILLVLGLPTACSAPQHTVTQTLASSLQKPNVNPSESSAFAQRRPPRQPAPVCGPQWGCAYERTVPAGQQAPAPHGSCARTTASITSADPMPATLQPVRTNQRGAFSAARTDNARRETGVYNLCCYEWTECRVPTPPRPPEPIDPYVEGRPLRSHGKIRYASAVRSTSAWSQS